MPRRKASGQRTPPTVPDELCEKVLGYINFSGGKPDATFLAQLNSVAEQTGFLESWQPLREQLESSLSRLRESSRTFSDSSQATAVMSLVFDRLLPAYREHHADLLFHLDPNELQNAFFLGRCFEAVLEQGGPWDEPERLVQGALDRLNDFLGYRPLAVLENSRRMTPYDHERFRPLPLYVAGAGTATGPYAEIVQQALELLGSMPSEVLSGSHFDLAQLDELAIDLRAYDHDHPVYKRTNYLFGEWDPHLIDGRGYYRRFVVRRIILEALVRWVAEQSNHKESIFDAGAVLCGTILMASSISGDTPACHDSTVSLTSLLPLVARQRDEFYLRLMNQATGTRARRLAKAAKVTQQPFGHVRQALNLHLAHYAARQVQHRHLATLYARMGHTDAARQEAAVIPSTSARFECELQWRITSIRIHLERSEVDAASALLRECEDLLQRAIHCGAFVDPWNILGFQGNFPLFQAREDSIPDQRVELLLDIMERLFGVFSRAMSETAALGRQDLLDELTLRYETVAGWWDQFAAHVIDDLPRVFGGESLESARHVAQALAEWRAAGEAAGDILFWRKHVEVFNSARSYACVAETLLHRGDHVAAMALLVQWLSVSDEVGVESGPFSIHALLLDWMKHVTTDSEGQPCQPFDWASIRRLFDFLEANAGDYWEVPMLDAALGRSDGSSAPEVTLEDWDVDRGDNWIEEGDSDDNLFSAAYEGIVFRDSTDDGHEGEVLDGGSIPGNTEFEVINRELEPRIKFVMALAQLWQAAATALAADRWGQGAPVISEDPSAAGLTKEEQAAPGEPAAEEISASAEPASDITSGPAAVPVSTSDREEVIRTWRSRLQRLQADLLQLMTAVSNAQVDASEGDHDANVEYDIQLQTKFYLLNTIIATHLNCRMAEIGLLCLLPDDDRAGYASPDERDMIVFYRAVLRRDVPETQQHLVSQFRRLSRKPLLYVPLDSDGDPAQILVARTVQTEIRFLLEQLPSLGLFRETWHVVRLAHRMERDTRPGQSAVTEFDRIFRAGLRNTIDRLIETTADWREGEFTDEDLISLIGDILSHYRDQWFRHSRTMRLSSAEGLRNDLLWEDVREFVERYGEELFHARSLTLGNVRTILHNGIDWFLEQLEVYEDPLHPSRLLEAIRTEELDLDDAVEMLELVYGTVVDRFDRFLEYNTTTTQSDYGDKFYVLLDFLRVESAYDRGAWERIPENIVHRSLAMAGRIGALNILETILEGESRQDAEKHLEELQELEQTYGVHLPSISDRLNERFVKPLAVNRMLALVQPSVRTASSGPEADEAFNRLREEIAAYMVDMAGSAVDVPQWLQDIEREVNRLEAPSDYIRPPELEVRLPAVPVTEEEVRNQLTVWGRAIGESERRPRRKNVRRPRRKKSD